MTGFHPGRTDGPDDPSSSPNAVAAHLVRLAADGLLDMNARALTDAVLHVKVFDLWRVLQSTALLAGQALAPLTTADRTRLLVEHENFPEGNRS
jgi:hypothetical protein